jgi:DNA polymerase
VASYYPSLMIEYNYGSRNMKNPDKYAEIYHARLKYKAEHNPIQGPLKIVLNGTYGAMKDKFNNLYDPRQSNNVCVGGQVLLLDLIERLEGTVDIIQSNTDGILVKLRAKNDAEANREYAKVDDICYEWEQRSRMKLEFDEFVEVWQKDVNNYVIIAADGSYKSKGAYVKKLSALDNDLPIVNKALINYMINGTPVEQTINESKKLIDFQKIVKLSKLYDYAMLGDKKLTDKTFRVYASNSFGTNTLFKVKNGKNPEKFANTPINCFIFNASLENKGLPQILDKQWYIDLAKERLKQFGVCEDGSI